MTAVIGHLEPVEYIWAESASPRMRETGRSVRTPVGVRRRLGASAVEQLRTIASMIWFSWLIAAGLVVGGTALVVVARIAWVVLRWAVAL